MSATSHLQIFGRAVPITRQRHAETSVETGADMSFAAQLTIVPVMVSELEQVARDMPIVLVDAGAPMPVAVLGFGDQRNRLVDAQGHWRGDYVPAFLRQYPFVLAGQDGAAELSLCLDEAFAGVNQAGRGQRLFAPDGARSPYLGAVLEFAEALQRDHLRTRRFGEDLRRLGLLEEARVTARGRETPAQLQGFQTVSEDRLNRLEDGQIAQLQRAGALRAVFAHLASLRRFERLLAPNPERRGS